MMDDWPTYGPGVTNEEQPVRRKRAGSRRMRLRTQWYNIMAEDGMPFVQMTAPHMVFEKHIKELRELGVTDDQIVESWRRFAVDCRRGLIPRNKAPWFSYWGRRSKYIQLEEAEQEVASYEDDRPVARWDDE